MSIVTATIQKHVRAAVLLQKFYSVAASLPLFRYQMNLAATCNWRELVSVPVITPAEPEGGAVADV